MRLAIFGVMILTAALSVFSTGCSKGTPTVTPAEAEKVPADDPIAEEKPSTDEK
jgi:hypothetical protein